MTPQIIKTEPNPLPVGEYRGTWSGYRITIEGQPFTIWTEQGNRGFFPVVVRVAADGSVTVS
jgi:hypothetical protein